MKKIISLLFVGAMIFTFTACSNTENSVNDSVDENSHSQISDNTLSEDATKMSASVDGGIFIITEDGERTTYEFYHPELEKILYEKDGEIEIYHMLEGEGEGSYITSNNYGEFYSTPHRVSAHYEEDDDEFWATYQDEDEEYHFPDYIFEDNTLTWIFTEQNYKPSEYELIIIRLETDSYGFDYKGYFMPDEFSNANEVVEFADPTVEAIVRCMLEQQKYPIPLEDLADITEFGTLPSLSIEESIKYGITDANGNITITTLDDLKHMPNITSIALSDCGITDISPLSELKKLNYINLNRNEITDISALSSLEHLTKLKVTENKITEVPVLNSYNSLESMELTDNNITDLSNLSNLTKLSFLAAGNNEIVTLPTVSNMTSLSELYLSENQISDLTPLSNAPALMRLSLESNNVTDATPLTTIEPLYLIVLTNNPISDISPLGRMANLTDLMLGYTNVTDFSSVAHLGERLWIG